jgi:hypothetical protein
MYPGFEYAHPVPGSKRSPLSNVSAANRPKVHGVDGKARTASWYADSPP